MKKKLWSSYSEDSSILKLILQDYYGENEERRAVAPKWWSDDISKIVENNAIVKQVVGKAKEDDHARNFGWQEDFIYSRHL